MLFPPVSRISEFKCSYAVHWPPPLGYATDPAERKRKKEEGS